MNFNIDLMTTHAPYHVAATNMLVPVFTISRQVMYEYLHKMVIYVDKIVTYVAILLTSLFSISKELYIMGSKELLLFGEPRMVLFVLFVALVGIGALYDNINYVFDINTYTKPLIDKINCLEKQVDTLHKNERTYDNEIEIFTRVIKNNGIAMKKLQNQMNTQFKRVERNITKMNKQITEYL